MKLRLVGGEKRYVLIDYFKGMAMLTIVLMHLIQKYMSALPHAINLAATFGGSGGHLFILASGFGLYLSHLRHPLNVKQFAHRRFFRVYIPYIIIVLISALLPWMYTGSGRGWALLSHIFLYKMFIPAYEISFGSQLWFVSTIIQFYIVFLLLAWVEKKLNSSAKFMILALAVSVCWWIIVAV